MNLETAEHPHPASAAVDDSALLSALLSGSSAAFDAVYQRHVRAVFAYSLSQCASRGVAEDLTQDTFVLFYEKAAKVRVAGDSVLPWLLVTAKNLARNIKRKYRREALGPEFDAAALSVATGGPEEAAEQSLLRACLAQAVRAPSPLDRQIVELCLVSDLSYQQAAAQLGITHAAVRNRLSRSRRSLRASLHQDQLQGES